MTLLRSVLRGSARSAAALFPLLAVACGGELPEGPSGSSAAPIVNGTPSPSYVSLTNGQQAAIGFLTLDPSASSFCTGTLIAPNVVLTAQHCVKDRDVTTVKFGIGTPGSPTTIVPVYRASLSYWEYDTALLQLRTSAVSSSSNVQPLALRRLPLSPAWIGTSAEASGYAPVDGISRRRFGVLEITNLLDNSIVANGNGLRGTCQGDSGGPLLVRQYDGTTALAGIVMGGNRSCVDDSYYARVDTQLAWIDEQLRTFASNPPPASSGGSSSGSGPGCADGGDPLSGLPALGVLLWLTPLRRRKVRGTKRA